MLKLYFTNEIDRHTDEREREKEREKERKRDRKIPAGEKCTFET